MDNWLLDVSPELKARQQVYSLFCALFHERLASHRHLADTYFPSSCHAAAGCVSNMCSIPQDLFNRMLDIKSERRINCDDIATHAWMQLAEASQEEFEASGFRHRGPFVWYKCEHVNSGVFCCCLF